MLEAGIISRFAVEDGIFAKPTVNATLQGAKSPYYQVEYSATTTKAPAKETISQPDARITRTGLSNSDSRSDSNAVNVTSELETPYATGHGKCFHCHKPGHYANACPELQRNRHQSGTSESLVFEGILIHKGPSRPQGQWKSPYKPASKFPKARKLYGKLNKYAFCKGKGRSKPASKSYLVGAAEPISRKAP